MESYFLLCSGTKNIKNTLSVKEKQSYGKKGGTLRWQSLDSAAWTLLAKDLPSLWWWCWKPLSDTVQNSCSTRLRSSDCEGRSIWVTPFTYSSHIPVIPCCLWLRESSWYAVDDTYHDHTIFPHPCKPVPYLSNAPSFSVTWGRTALVFFLYISH